MPASKAAGGPRVKRRPAYGAAQVELLADAAERYERSMITTSCHCGAVHLAIASAPTEATDCNCSICRRYGVLWAYYTSDDVEVRAAPDGLDLYAWDEKSISFMRCRTCGCVTHWAPRDPSARRIGVNLRLADPAVLGAVKVRRLDGADTWRYLDVED